MKKIIALIYQSYERRNLRTPYFNALMTIINGVLIISALVWGVLHAHFPKRFPFSNDNGINLIVVGFYIVLLLVLFSLAIKKEELKKYQFAENKIKRVTFSLIIYFSLLMLLLLTVLILRAKNKI
jgi:uncharacterized membrane protein YGL010W